MRSHSLYLLAAACCTLTACGDSVGPDGSGIVLVVAGGNDQTGTPMDTLAESLTVRAVRLIDGVEEPVAGLALVWEVDSGDLGLISPAFGETDTDGYLSTRWRLGVGSGTQRVNVHVGNSTESVEFEAAALPGFVPANLHRGQCAIDTAGAAWCWTSQQGPVRVAPGLQLATMTGTSNRCGLTGAGAAWCWGSAEPVPIAPELTFGMLSIDFGRDSRTVACGITTNGEGYCWRVRFTSGPENILLPIPGGHDWLEIERSRLRTCAVDIAHDVWCWDAGTGEEPLDEPIRETLVSNVTDLRVGQLHACGRMDGQYACWGSDRLGDPSVAAPGPSIPLGDGEPFVEIEIDDQLTYGINASGRVFVWGASTFPAFDLPSPVSLPGEGPWSSLRIANGAVCATLTADGTIYCWYIARFMIDPIEPRPISDPEVP